MLIRLFLPVEPVHVELANKGSHVVVLEENRKKVFGEPEGVVYLEASTILGPRNNFLEFLVLNKK